jgi:DNA-binding NtrC family response regulator
VSRVVLKFPDGRDELTVNLANRRVSLLGRMPDSQTAHPGAEVEGWPLETVPLARTSVSANHAAVWTDGQGVCVRDLGSKNGTWLFLPKFETVRVSGPEVVLQLAQPAGGEGASDEPTPPIWSDARTYARAMAGSIEQWLSANGVEVRTNLIDESGSEDPPPWRLRLATGQALDIEPVGTASVRSARLFEQLLRWTERQNCTYETEEETRREGMILASSAIRAAHREVVDAAKRGAHTLLITGPTGAGKEMLAEVFHRHTGRSGPMIPLNCSLLSKEMLHAQLFGAEAHSFTDAKRRIIGAVERAQGGTLFLDEVGEINSEVQPMLLRFLDRREYQRLGQFGQVQHADVRVVAATNRNLREAARAGVFRDDLRWRLCAYVVEVPPLRSRWDDVCAYLDTVRTGDGRTTLREALSSDALDLLRDHPWEGNFRELTNFAERVSRSVHGKSIDAASCRRVLEPSRSMRCSSPAQVPLESAPADWAALATRAVHVFREDYQREPSSWDDLKEWHEKYLKPLLFAHLSGAARCPPPVDGEVSASLSTKCAALAKADRGTAHKQLTRYFERFRL